MSVLIRQAKVVDPNSEFHNKVVDISLPLSSDKRQEKLEIKISEGNISSAILLDDEIVWEASKRSNDTEEGLYISPGFVDVFAEYCEPGFEHKETIASGLKAAAAGGFTDVLLSPNTNPVLSTKSIIQFVAQKAKNNVVNLHPLGAITQNIEGGSLAEMLDMHANGAVAFTDGWKPVQHANLMLKALEYAKSFNGVLLQIPLDASLSLGGLMHEGEISTRLGMEGIPVLAETILIHRDIELLRYTNSRLHITGVSTEAGVEMIRKAKKEGLNITCSITPYHCALTDEALQTYDSVYKVSPVLRTEQDRQALVAGLKDGTIDCIATHHRPQDWDAKSKEFEYASNGMNIQEIAFNVLLGAVENTIPLERIIDALAIRPRKIFGLSSLAIGNESTSFTLFSTNEFTNFTSEKVQSLSGNNPFIGKELKGKVIAIFNQNQFHINR
ncbi:MAG TPA: dihydroorotase [Flavipsychrobacter sp.]|nr:dihydroorotase [Flavipsychrobacter sp.]